jgi:hypothetical protein
VHEGGNKIPIRELKLDYKKPWVIQHQRAIISAYRTSAYFEYYQDELFEILDRKYERLFDLNLALIEFFIEKTGIKVDLRLTEEYNIAPDIDDLRDVIHPKRPNSILSELDLEKPYFQVFSQKYGFQEDLSIMDLLFNEGPDSIMFLKRL